jgi:hypothetical protein
VRSHGVQGVSSSNLGAPTNIFNGLQMDRHPVFCRARDASVPLWAAFQLDGHSASNRPLLGGGSPAIGSGVVSPRATGPTRTQCLFRFTRMRVLTASDRQDFHVSSFAVGDDFLIMSDEHRAASPRSGDQKAVCGV